MPPRREEIKCQPELPVLSLSRLFILRCSLVSVFSKGNKMAKVIIIRESVMESIITDTFTFATVVGIILVGKWVNSDALQWIGGFMTMMLIMSWASNKERLTVNEARAKLDQIERECNVKRGRN